MNHIVIVFSCSKSYIFGHSAIFPSIFKGECLLKSLLGFSSNTGYFLKCFDKLSEKCILMNSLSHGLSIFQEERTGRKDSLKLETNAEPSKDSEGGEIIGSKPDANKSETEKSVPSAKKDSENSPPSKLVSPSLINLFEKGDGSSPDNEFEKCIRPEVIPANEIGVTFADIGALDEIKESLQELVMLPLQRPDLFNGGLLKPCRGILLFGPPGTGKTMLAKAIANEAGASFINVSMSTITSKWFREDEKNVRALFTLTAKVSPTIIFLDEVDSMLGQRTRVGEHEALRKIKNEFMTHWDGLLTKPGERILVLAATNRPFDLEAIIRRFERRIMVGLPSVESREMILRTLLGKEKVENLDFKELAAMTEGYSGSDLKNLCITAAYRPVRELIQKERLKDVKNKERVDEQKKKERVDEGQSSEDASDTKEEGKEERVIVLRPLNMEDMRQYKFFVDGEWRHDEHQPFVSGNYGVVNTVFLAREPDVIPAIYTLETPGRSSMDVDNDPFFHFLGANYLTKAFVIQVGLVDKNKAVCIHVVRMTLIAYAVLV
ncbi:ATPase family AAA domain-containing protein 1-A [Camellia lanceoleosa]|uniref:ATPase family AAA domain-containing protein 1-A n=1 Tax=Camellia lanceoleosa TaxID=1840588 RepID=A0ACC0FRU0_9ERIC|nr:ATPase family AAA domain-containing protein 1-A [Camellia lanceoleosa]